jgi:hypothetical protein
VIASARIDHLVVAADSLVQGDAWCESTLGVVAGPGGEHPLMGTHNRLLRVATVDHPRTYLEVMARNPQAAPITRSRWFDLDDATLLARLRDQGSRLIHWVVQVPDVAQAVAAWRALGIDRGEVLEASRMTPRGLLQWRITVRPDGRRLFDGCLPTLIEWGDHHPAATMPESGVTFHGLAITHPDAGLLRTALEAIGLDGVQATEGPANLSVLVRTPAGARRLESGGW